MRERDREGERGSYYNLCWSIPVLFSHTGNTDTGNTSGCLPPESGFLEYSKRTSKGNYESEGNKVARLQMRLTGYKVGLVIYSASNKRQTISRYVGDFSNRSPAITASKNK